jgi:hypothetical protein
VRNKDRAVGALRRRVDLNIVGEDVVQQDEKGKK